MKFSLIISAIAAIAIANPQNDVRDPCDKCDKKFLACKQSWACWFNPPQCDRMCECRTQNFEDCKDKCHYNRC
ncbi:hypothetical protein K458DRAFT_381546 [Lentithecium fluviatile CBS 122367]|uniref:Uncharacterized protein n=1 Tax=Lentithecium fluviatile CBS 122367 TaxID=1168545 RepID=A0A6G1JNG7_9PLEO|nr:hypothetical protein K458DRAFT_381546 [Lentithecium fluviatile CBS 122367]